MDRTGGRLADVLPADGELPAASPGKPGEDGDIAKASSGQSTTLDHTKVCSRKVDFVEETELQLFTISEVTEFKESPNPCLKVDLKGNLDSKIDVAESHSFQSPDSAPAWEQAKVLIPVQKLYYQLDTTTRDTLLNIIKHVKSKKSTPCMTYVIEFCCDEDSELGKQSQTLKNIEVLRVTERMDAMSPQTLKSLLEYAEKHPGCHIHSSIPCTAWTNVQNLNVAMHGEPFGLLKENSG